MSETVAKPQVTDMFGCMVFDDVTMKSKLLRIKFAGK